MSPKKNQNIFRKNKTGVSASYILAACKLLTTQSNNKNWKKY